MTDINQNNLTDGVPQQGAASIRLSASTPRAAPTLRANTTLRPMFGFKPLRSAPEPVGPYRPYHPAMPMMKNSTSGMSAEQRADYNAACDGKITWRQYFMKWGGLSL